MASAVAPSDAVSDSEWLRKDVDALDGGAAVPEEACRVRKDGGGGGGRVYENDIGAWGGADSRLGERDEATTVDEPDREGETCGLSRGKNPGALSR